MPVEHDLAMGVLMSHPLEAAQVLERLPAAQTADMVGSVRPEDSAACLRWMHGPAASEILEAMEVGRAAKIVALLPLDVASGCLRRMDADRRERLLAQLGGQNERSLRSLLRFSPQTAGALMDPAVLALPMDLSVEEATLRVRRAAAHARYNLYTLDREQRLMGVFNLRELLLAQPHDLLSSIARPNPHRLSPDADRHAIITHPGWREVHALPVAERNGLYLGAIRYRTLRRIEDELRGVGPEASATARALGELFRAGASSLLEAMAASPGSDTGRANDAS